MIDGKLGCHTDAEPFPWWQVDLQATCRAHSVRIFNRQECAVRLRNFSILASLDGHSWLVVFRKTDQAVFGRDNLEPYVARLPEDTVARFIRIRLDGYQYLHLCECEVLGKVFDGRSARLAESKFRGQLRELEREEERRKKILIDGREGSIVTIGGNGVFVDVKKYSEPIVRALRKLTYEGRERRLVGTLLRPNDRVLEIGTAIGVVSMTAARLVGADNVLTYEANPEMAADAQRNFAFNGLESIQSRVGILCNRLRYASSPSEIEFSISKDFWASRILPVGTTAEDIVRKVQVPTACLEKQIAEHHATVLICDIEGGEAELLMGADLTGLRLIIMETHEAFVGVHPTDEMIRSLVMNGFNVDLIHSGERMAVLRR